MAHNHQAIRIYLVAVTRDNDPHQNSPTAGAADILRHAGFTVAREASVSDNPELIGQYLQRLATQNRADAVILIGGTGIGHADHTYEAIERSIEKKIDGFGEILRRLWFDKVGVQAILVRAIAGVIHETVVFAIPSAEAGLQLALEQLIIPILPETLDLASGRTPNASMITMKAKHHAS